MTRWYGSVNNRLDEGLQVGELHVGMGATEMLWSDRRAYTVQQIISPSRVIVTRDKAERVDNNGYGGKQVYEYTSTPLVVSDEESHCAHPFSRKIDESERADNCLHYDVENDTCKGCKFLKKGGRTNGKTLIKTKLGWKELGHDSRFMLGKRQEYYDPSF